MVVGLLTLAAIPTVIAVSEGIAEKDKPKNETQEKRQMRKFNLTCWCEGTSKGKSEIHGAAIVLGDGKMWVQSHTKTPTERFYPFEGFYIEYPDDQRPKPAPLGMVTKIADNPPLMNWIYLDRRTSEVKHGNRTESRPHRVGDWGFTNDDDPENNDEEEPGGVEFDGEENFVAVEPPSGDTEGRWEVRWDQYDNHLRGNDEITGRKVFGISLERSMVKEGST